MKHRRRHGFTLVEILVAITVIAVLASILYLGARAVGASTRERSTRVTLKTLQSLLTEYQSRGGDMAKINIAYYQSPLTGQELMRWDENYPQMGAGSDQIYSNGNLYSAGSNTAVGALRRTQIVMITLMSVPENKAIIDKLVSNSPDLFLKQKDSKQLVPGPILLDAWGSPILFAPGRTAVPPGDAKWGVTGMYVTGDPNSQKKDEMIPKNWNASFQSPDGKGMFVSAGPDTVYSQGDDNIYSYER